MLPQRLRCFEARTVAPLSLFLSYGPHLSFNSRGGPISVVQENSHGAKIEPATVKRLRPCPGPTIVAVFNADGDSLAVGKNGQEPLISHWEANENHWAHYGLCCYQWFYTAAHQGFGLFFFSSSFPSWECDSLKWRINQTFW